MISIGQSLNHMVKRTMNSIPNPLSKYRVPNAFLTLLLANGLANLVQFLINIGVARLTAPEDYGVFSVTTSLARTLSLFINAGTMATLVRLLGDETRKDMKPALLQAVLLLELLLSGLLLLPSLVLSDRIGMLLKIPSEYDGMIFLASVTAFLFILQKYYLAYFQANRNYSFLTSMALSYSALRIAVVAPVFLLALRSVRLELFFAAAYTLPLLVLVVLFGKWILVGLELDRFVIAATLQATRQILGYSRWVVVSTIGYPLLAQIPIFLIATNISTKEVGIYSAGMIFSMVFSLLNYTARQITLPTVSRLKTYDEMLNYVRRLRAIAPLYVAGAIFLIASMGFVMLTFLGDNYREAFPIFVILSGSTAIVILLGQVNLLAHALYRPHIAAVQTIAQVVLLSLGGFALVSFFDSGAVQVSGWFAAVIICGELGTLGYIFHLLQRLKEGKLVVSNSQGGLEKIG